MQHKERIHKNDKFTCDQCEYQAMSKTHLNRHIESVHKQPQPQHKCSKCDYKSPSKAVMIQHNEIIHKKQHCVSKRIRCGNCEKKFNKRETYEKHMRLIHGTNRTKSQQEVTFQKYLRSNNNNKNNGSALDSIN